MTTPLAKLRDLLSRSGLDALLISSVSNIVYLTDYTGFFTTEREGFLLACKGKRYFITDARSSEEIKKQVRDFELAEISSGFPLKKLLEKLADKHKIKLLGIEEKNLTVSEFKLIKKHFKTKHFDLNKIRSIKNSSEISKIEKACKLGDKTFTHILKRIKLGISEKEVANEIESFIKKNGGDLSFPSIVAFGKNSAIPHHVPNNDKLINNQIIKLDFGVKLNHYCSDMTRTVFFGRANEQFKKMYNTVLRAQKLAIDYLSSCHSELVSESPKSRSRNKFGMTGKKVDRVARDHIVSKGYPTIPHSLGHGIGLDVHEAPSLSPKSKDILKEGMVFSIEPGIYLPDFGGVRIEDLAVIEKENLRLLTKSPKNIIAI